MYWDLWSFEVDLKFILSLTCKISNFAISSLILFGTQGAKSSELTLMLSKILVPWINLTHYD